MAHLKGVWLLIVAVMVMTCLSSALVSGAPQLEQSTAGETDQGNGLLSILNFEHYQKLFEKHYGSQLEEVTRKVYFYAEAFAVCVAAWAYRARRSSHYLALNDMSDWSRRELDMTVNKVLAGWNGRAFSDGTENSLPVQASEQDLARMANELEAGIREKLQETLTAGKPGGTIEKSAESAGLARRKREARSLKPNRRGPRRLPMDKLIQASKPLAEPANVRAKTVRKPKSNNPNYDELAMELDTRGLVDQQQEVSEWKFDWPQLTRSKWSFDEKMDEEAPRGRFDSVKELLVDLSWNVFDMYRDGDDDSQEGDSQGDSADVMFADLRQSNCMWQPRRQGQCGSCYAFAAVTMAEFMVCNATQHLYSFSEQYLIDCGKSRVRGMNGCDGASLIGITKFVHNFGQELRVRYPYSERDDQCPYSDQTDLKATGFVRLDLEGYSFAPVAVWPEVLKHSPLLVAVAIPPDFRSYAGGVDQGQWCKELASHAMLVVGHGREDGHEFWLLRNSYGTSWGDGGYYKLAKAAPKRCIAWQEGLVWASRNGVDFRAEPKLNLANRRVKLDFSERRG